MEWLKQYGLLAGVGVVGLGLLGYGLWGEIMPEKSTVEIIKESENQSTKGEIVVDVAGAVEKTGVYKLPSGARIGDAIVMAGGLAADADREWVAQTLNLAKEIKDQEKIYIPSIARVDPLQSEGSTLGLQKSGKININTASLGELDQLPGIGEVRAQAIIANRPYGSTEELVSKAKIPQSVYDKIKDSLSIY